MTLIKSKQLTICFAILLMIFCVQIVVGSVFPKEYLIEISAGSAVLNFILCGYLYHSGKNHLTDSSEKIKKAEWIFVFILGASLCIVVTMFLTFLQWIRPEWFIAYNEMIAGLNLKTSFITILYALLIAPVAEETIFRGAIFSESRKGFSFREANGIQALFFGLYHMNLIQGIYAFVIGLAFGLIKERTGRIFAAILAHISFNTTTYLLGILFPGDSMPDARICVILFTFCLILVSVLIRFFLSERNIHHVS